MYQELVAKKIDPIMMADLEVYAHETTGGN